MVKRRKYMGYDIKLKKYPAFKKSVHSWIDVSIEDSKFQPTSADTEAEAIKIAKRVIDKCEPIYVVSHSKKKFMKCIKKSRF